MSDFLTGLLNHSPSVASSSDNKENQAVMHLAVDPNAIAGPSKLAVDATSGQKGELAILQDKDVNDDSLMYGVELDTSMLEVPAPSRERSTTGPGLHGVNTTTSGKTSASSSSRKTLDKGKGKARDSVPYSKPHRCAMDVSFQAVRVYKCPATDRPLYTLDAAKRTIKIHATDADPSFWPSKAHQRSTPAAKVSSTAPTFDVDAKQQPSSSTTKKDWHEPVNSETKQCLIWKQKCGAGLASLLNLNEPKSWKLADWPDGYKMFIKHQYQSQYSFFHYIIGSSFLCTKRFTTAKEYTNHLYWLCTYGNDICARCKCKFCVREFEKEGKRRTAIIQRCVRVPDSDDRPPPAKRAKRHGSNMLKRTQRRLAGPTFKIPAPRDGSKSMPVRSARHSSVNPPRSTLVPPSLASSALPLVQVAGGPFSKVFGDSTSDRNMASPESAISIQNKDRKGGPPLQATAGTASDTKQIPLVEIDTPNHANITTTLTESGVVLPGTLLSESPLLGKRKRGERKDYYIRSIKEMEAAEAAIIEASLSLTGTTNGNGRAARSTRNQKSMKEPPPSPPLLTGPSGPTYAGPFIHRKRHDDLKIHSAPYREHEIVWYKLKEAHVCPTNPKVRITHWPSEVIAKTLQIETHHVEIVSIRDMNGDLMDIPQSVHIQYYMYTITLMGVEGNLGSIECRVEDFLPWVAYYTTEVMRGMQASELLRRTDTPLESLHADEEDFHKVLTIWAWARHWADAIRRHLSPFGLFFDAETLKKMRRRKTGGFFSGASKQKRHRAEKEAREKEMLSETDMIANTVQQYQGIWFGSEKIWVGDMIRLAGTFGQQPPADLSEPFFPASHLQEAAYLQLYKGRSLREDKGLLVKLDGHQINAESVGRPAFLHVTHIYRVPGQNEEPGSLQFDGIYYELVKADMEKVRNPPSLFGDIQGVLDMSDISSSSSTEQNTAVGLDDREKKQDVPIPGLYRRELVPPAPFGYAFKPLKKLPSISDEDGPTGILPYMIAGRYYPPEVLFPDANDPQTRKLVRSISGKTYRPDTLMKPTHWLPNRRAMLRSSRKLATKDMENYFLHREEKERMIKLSEQMKHEESVARKTGEEALVSDENEAPVVTTVRTAEPTSSIEANNNRAEEAPEQLTVTPGDQADSDTIAADTTKS